MTRRKVAIFGSTGSIGINALKVVAALKDRVKIQALSADSNIKLLAAQAKIFKPKVIAVRDSLLAGKIRRMIPSAIKVLHGRDALSEMASRDDVDMAVFAISGSACLIPLLGAIKSKKMIGLANKEALVSAGRLIIDSANKNKVTIIPIDSEHSAIFQCLQGRSGRLNKIYLTATGGPLLNVAKNKFDSLPLKAVLNHPRWNMGKKISVDSATLMNKGLEIIEARWLFDIDEKDIDVLIHPQAIVHSMVEFKDTSIFAQMSVPDMRIPIQYAITYPDRFKCEAGRVNFTKIKNLSFGKPDLKKFPCLSFARHALRMAGTFPAVLNAADEEAVSSYLKGGIKFSRIPLIIEKVMARHKSSKKYPSIDDILDAESWARQEAIKLCYL